MEEKILDSYQQFFEIVSKDKFFEFGLANIIHINIQDVKTEWINLLERIKNRSTDLYVRNSGRNGTGNALLTQLYLDVFKLKINYDQTNNNQPSMLLQRLTDKRKNKNIFNYQVSHVYGRTKNVFCFTAPWNIVFIPKIIDPFTGHEAKGCYVDEFKTLFQSKIFKLFQDEIVEFNNIMSSYRPTIKEWLSNTVAEKDRNKYLKEFEKINLTRTST